MTPHMVMTDSHGRRMRKLRISLLDACNMRCVYCMPDQPHFLPKADWATPAELVAIAGHLRALGIEEIRLTGGEPTLRPELLEIVQGLSRLNLHKLGLTTNGLLLEEKLEALADTKCRYLNISLDSLERQNFLRITGRDAFDTVMRGILRARDLGFSVKINVVALRGLNEHEVPDFVAWSGREGITVRFLEAMNIGVMKEQYVSRLIPAHDMIAGIRQQYHLTPNMDAPDATAYSFTASNGANIGFIASESEPFCGGCSRLRLTPQGQIRPCLFKEDGIDLKSLAPEEYPAALAQVIAMKPYGRIAHVAQPMYQIGG